MTDQTLINYFTQIDSREGLFLWMCMLIAFLIGFIIAYLLRSGKVRRLKKELSEARQQLETNQTLLTSAQDQLKQRNAELQEESREKVDLMERLRSIEQEKGQQLHEVVALNQRLEEIQTTNRTYSHTIDELNSQIIRLKTQNEELLEHPQNFADTTAPSIPVPSREVAELRERLNVFEASLSRLSGENQALRSDLANLKSQPTTNTVVDPAVEAGDGELVLGNDKTVLYDKIIVSDRDKDTLTKIEGIGEFLEKKLNSIGVFSYEDIANWTPGRIDQVTTQIGYIPGRIEKDDWVGQAALLLQKEQETSTPRAFEEASEATDKKATDLKMIEGIGPKIEEVLKDAGIGDWSALAAAEPGRLKEILEEAGDQYRMHNPYTWPLQARLAAAGRWEEFDTYQQELKGGRE